MYALPVPDRKKGIRSRRTGAHSTVELPIFGTLHHMLRGALPLWLACLVLTACIGRDAEMDQMPVQNATSRKMRVAYPTRTASSRPTKTASSPR